MIKLEQNIETKLLKKSMKKNVGSFKIDKTVGWLKRQQNQE